ncbi:hypothetical protein [Planktothrix agardhii]|uniref:hypothetical protein n=1 Tax=Planktothrix agardhii TaxID=1160 RepID=UPI0020B32F4A|nr:hypothetical protein [Planktothrix agardhii]CAD5985400.1 hypothetical protein PCC7811_04565 [Planktothrix agardhii]CAD5985421.1 hypothetical protein PCC7811_04568 [Planktothrix agardhii]
MPKLNKFKFLPGCIAFKDGTDLPYIKNDFELVYFDGVDRIYQGYTKIRSSLSILKDYNYQDVFKLWQNDKGYYIINHAENTCKHTRKLQDAINLLDRMGGTLALELSLYFM